MKIENPKLKIGKMFLLLFLGMFFSCASMQDDVYVDSLSGNSEISSFELRFSEIDAAYFSSDEALKDKDFEKKAEILIVDIEKAAENPGVKKAVAARLYALAGCLAFDLNRKSQAKKYHEMSVDSFKGDARALVLAHRLGIEKNLAEKTKLFSDKSILILESALTSYSSCDYAKALASFDEAFLSLEPFYRDYYGKLRDKSWNLRSVSGSKSELLALERISVLQMILIANEDSDLLFNYTSGKALSEKVLAVDASSTAVSFVERIAEILELEGSAVLSAMLSVIAKYHIMDCASLYDVAQYMADFGDDQRVEPDTTGRVIFITSHESKGMEWKAVLMVDDYRADEKSEEQNRLIYVAMTRAADVLYVFENDKGTSVAV